MSKILTQLKIDLSFIEDEAVRAKKDMSDAFHYARRCNERAAHLRELIATLERKKDVNR